MVKIMWWSRKRKPTPIKLAMSWWLDEVFRLRRKKLWPDAKARIIRKVPEMDYTPASIRAIEQAVKQEETWDWD